MPIDYVNRNDKRQVFKTKDGRPITAAGTLVYKSVNYKPFLLLIQYQDPKWPKLDDFGGKCDLEDKNVYETIKRELSEETNGKFTHEISENDPSFYNPASKYFCVITQVGRHNYEDTSIFGSVEIKENIPRKINWYPYPECKDLLAQRLNCQDLFIFLNKIS